MATKQNQTPAKKDEGNQLPAHLRNMEQYAGMGTENIGTDDIEVPRLKLLQAISPEVQEGDHKPGAIYHTVAEESLGQQVEIIPVFVDIRYILWRPRHEGGGILARADDGVHWNKREDFEVQPFKDNKKKRVTWSTKSGTVKKSGLAEWGSMDPEDPDSAPAANLMYNVVCLMPEFPEYSPAVLTFQRSQIKVAKKFLGKLKIAQAPSFALRFLVEGIKTQNPDGQDYFNFKVTGNGFVEDEDMFNRAYSLYQHFKSEGLQIKDEESMQEDEPEANTSSEPEGEAAY
jgi:hypothetical protein